MNNKVSIVAAIFVLLIIKDFMSFSTCIQQCSVDGKKNWFKPVAAMTNI